MSTDKMRPRIEQMQFGPQLFEYIQKLIDSIETISTLEDIALNVDELNDVLEVMKERIADLNEDLVNKLDALDFVPRLTVLEDTITFIGQHDLFIDINAKAVELRTVLFENVTNFDILKVIMSEYDDFSTEDYSSLERRELYDITNIPLLDKTNKDKFTLKIRFINKTQNNTAITVKYRIKLTNFVINEEV